MSDKTVMNKPEDGPTIACAACGKPLPIFESLDSLPSAFEKKCGFCGEEFLYKKSDIKS
ncbi:MAG: hypothetical protein V3T39_00755 [Gammaproteobacteria bacterium]